MPRFFPDGTIIAGVGGGVVSVWPRTAPMPTIVATNAGGACVLDHRAIYQQDAHLDTYNPQNGEIATIDPQGSFELAAGGGVYAAKFDGVRISNQPGQRFVGYGVGDVGPDGSVLLKTPDGKFQGRLLEDIQSLGGSSWSALEGRRPVCSPDVPTAHVVPGVIYGFRRFGNFCCYLAEDGARFIVQHLDRPVGKVLAVTNAAYRPDLVLIGNDLWVTYALSEGEPPQHVVRVTVNIADLTETLGAIPTPGTPVPNPGTPEPPKPEPMPTPNYISVVRAVDAEFPDLLKANTKASCGTFTEIVAQRLHTTDPEVGLVSKSPGEKQYRGHAIDALKFRTSGQVVDIIEASGAKDDGEDKAGRPGWSEVPSRDGNNWMEPIAPDGGTPEPPPTQDPPVVVYPMPDPRVTELWRRVEALEADVKALKEQPAPVLTLPELKVVADKDENAEPVSTDRNWGHAHTVRLKVVAK